jgi:TolA-binding protein/predicted negative regulator of RcsB-dependent stress response
MKTNIFVSLTICALAAKLAPGAFAQTPAPAPAPAVTAGDSKELEAALALVREQKWKDAMQALEKWRDKYGKLSPRAVDAKYNLAICYLQQEKPLFDDAARELRQLMAEPETKVAAASKEQFQLLIAKATTLKALDMPSDTEVQKGAQVKMFEMAIKEYDTFLTSFSKSRSADSAWFSSGELSLQAEKWEDAAKRFNYIVQNFPQSPLQKPSLMNVGKTFLSQAYSLMAEKGGKTPGEAEIQQALNIFETGAMPALQRAYQESRDLAVMNEVIYYIGQVQLTRSQNVMLPDEDAKKRRQQELLGASLDAFRAVRSREEVIQEQDKKIAELKRQISLLNPANQNEYLPTKNYYDNLIQLEEQKKKKFLDDADQFLGARLAISRIFLFLKKPDECRALLRYLQGQKEVFEAEKNKIAAKDQQADISALLALTYLEQKNVEKGTESAEAFRTTFKGHEAGENIPLILANLNLEKGKADVAESIIRQAEEDYKEWRFKSEGNSILVGVALEKGDFEKANSLVDALLGSNPKPDIEEQTLFLKANVLRAMGSQKSDRKKAEEALTVLKTLRDKYPNGAKAEDAWFEECSIAVGLDPTKAQPELQKFIDQFSKGGGKSENTPKNVAVAQFLLGKVLHGLEKPDEAIKAYRALIDKWPESEPAPTAFFKIFEIHNEKKEFNTCVKLMEEFIQKYPKHENVYFSYNNIAEILFSGVLRPKGPANSPAPFTGPTVADTEAGTKKLRDFVDYELALTPEVGKEPAAKRGDGSMIP